MTCKHRAVSAYSFASVPRRGNSPYTPVSDPRYVDEDQLRALNDYYVAHTNWLVHRGRHDLIDTIADEYERDVRALRSIQQEPGQAA